MDTTFTASEVRELAEWLSAVSVMGTGKTCHVLHAYADRLEADEMARTVSRHSESGAMKRGCSMTNETEIEQEIKDKGLNAPRLTPEKIDATIANEAYYVFPGTTLTVCCLTLRNGYTVVGESAAASPANFDEALGRKIARQHARDKIWALEGYALREKLAA